MHVQRSATEDACVLSVPLGASCRRIFQADGSEIASAAGLLAGVISNPDARPFEIWQVSSLKSSLRMFRGIETWTSRRAVAQALPVAVAAAKW